MPKTHKFSIHSISPQKSTSSGSRTDAYLAEFPVLKNLAASYLLIQPKGFRAPHWHPNANELSYIEEGKALLTVFGVGNAHHTFLLEAGQMGFVPMGALHSIENVGTTPLKIWVCFSHEAPEDLELTDSILGMPNPILGDTFKKDAAYFAQFKKPFKEGFITSQSAPRTPDLAALVSSYKLDLEATRPQLQNSGGWVKMSNNFLFPVLDKLAAYSLSLSPGGAREPHWHPNAAELNILMSGTARITLLFPGGGSETFDMQAGDMSYMPQGYIHHIENTGSTPARYIIFFAHTAPSDIGISGCLGAYPNELLGALFNLPMEFLESLPKYQQDLFIVGGG